jgi:hypothetical protein
MNDLRLVDCPTDRQTVADRVGPHSVRCRICHVLICTCAGCGGMTLVALGIVLRCSPCGFERMALPADLDGVAPPVRTAPAPQVQKAQQRRPADPFLGMPMPRQRGAR